MLITYRFKEEAEFAKYYAEKLNDQLTLSILKSGIVNSSDEAKHLSHFFWHMVDAAVEDHNKKIDLPWIEGSEFWSEKIMYSIAGYLESAGYGNEWEEISDQQDSETY